MKPGKKDIPVGIKIQGDELDALQGQTYLLSETFGLDRRIDAYRGSRPLRLYRWDLEVLIDVLTLVEAKTHRPRRIVERETLAVLKQRLQRVYAEAYGDGADR